MNVARILGGISIGGLVGTSIMAVAVFVYADDDEPSREPAHCSATWGGRVVVLECDDGRDIWIDRVGLNAALDGEQPDCNEYAYAPYWCEGGIES